MYDPLAMRIVQRFGNGLKQTHNLVFRKSPFVRNVIIECLTINVVHHKKWVAVILLESANLYDIRVDKLHRHEGFILQLPIRHFIGNKN